MSKPSARITIDKFIVLTNRALAEMRALNEPGADAPLARWTSALLEVIADQSAEAEQDQ